MPQVFQYPHSNVFCHGPALGFGNGIDLDDCITKFMIAWARIHACLTDEDIAKAHDMRRR